MPQWTALAIGYITSKLFGHQYHVLINSLETGDGFALAFIEVKKIIQ